MSDGINEGRREFWNRIRGTAVAGKDVRYTTEALKGADGQEVPLTLENGGPVIGTATLRFDPATGNLEAEMQINDPDVAEFLRQPPPTIG